MNYFEKFSEVLQEESNALLRAKDLLNDKEVNQLIELFEYLKQSRAELFICGVGKSGIIGQKMVSTFNSIGLTSTFLHPVEALHGDLGRLKSEDAIVFISKSGTTEEIAKLIPYLSIPKERMVGLLGSTNSKIASECGILFNCSVDKEACINNQAPTTSSTVALAFGDAIAVCFEMYTGLSKEGFATNHPGGLLGKSLRLKVESLMLPKESCGKIEINSNLQEVIIAMTEYPTGLCAVYDQDKFMGIIVEGDIRRTLVKRGDLNSSVNSVYNPNPIVTTPNDLAINALKVMENRERPLNVLPVMEGGDFMGVLRLHDLIKEGLKLPHSNGD